jgi:hypothetical protein
MGAGPSNTQPARPSTETGTADVDPTPGVDMIFGDASYRSR